MNPGEVKTILDELREVIERATFERIIPPPGMQAYKATQDGWTIFVGVFVHPKTKERGCEATASGVLKADLVKAKPSPLIVRLTPELAELAVKRAEGQLLS